MELLFLFFSLLYLLIRVFCNWVIYIDCIYLLGIFFILFILCRCLGIIIYYEFYIIIIMILIYIGQLIQNCPIFIYLHFPIYLNNSCFVSFISLARYDLYSLKLIQFVLLSINVVFLLFYLLCY